VLAALLLQPKKAKLRNGRVTFTHQGRNYIFADRHAYALNEREGQEVLCFFDEARMDCVHVYDAKGAHIQTIRRLGEADITDPRSIADSIATVKAIENQAIASIRSRHTEEAAEIAGMILHNETVAPGSQLDPSIRRALGLNAASLHKICPAAGADAVLPATAELQTEISEGSKLPASAPAGLSRSLEQSRQAGPLSPGHLAQAAALAGAHAAVETSRAAAEKIARANERAIDRAAAGLSAEEIESALGHETPPAPQTFT